MFRALFALLIVISQVAAAQPVEVVDDTGTVIRLAEPARRIVSLAPSLTELSFAAGAGDKLVGVIEYSDFPAEALEIPRVGRYDLLDMERILSMEPDLVLAWLTGNPRATVTRLRELGLTVYIAEPRNLDSISAQLRRIARLAGTEASATPVIEEFEGELARLQNRYQNAEPVSTFYQVWNDPLISVGGNELINDIISLCGGRNVFADLNRVAPKVSLEAVLAREPQAIIGSGADAGRPDWLDDWKGWPTLPAVASGHVFHIPPDLVQRHTLRALHGARLMCEQLQQVRARR